MDTQLPDSADSAPTALADLIAAGLVSHELIGDPAKLGGEAAALAALCGLVSGPVWRIEPYHYAFRTAGADAEAAAEALEASLQAALGPDAVWVSATDAGAEADAGLDQPLLLLRAQAGAVEQAAGTLGADLQAVVSARFAASAARMAAGMVGDMVAGAAGGAATGGATGPLAARLAAIEARQEEILAALAAESVRSASMADMLETTLGRLTGRLEATLAGTMARLEEQAGTLSGHIAREDIVAGRLGELSAMAVGPAAFQESLGVTLAEFLAQIERRAEMPLRVPQFS